MHPLLRPHFDTFANIGLEIRNFRTIRNCAQPFIFSIFRLLICYVLSLYLNIYKPRFTCNIWLILFGKFSSSKYDAQRVHHPAHVLDLVLFKSTSLTFHALTTARISCLNRIMNVENYVTKLACQLESFLLFKQRCMIRNMTE